MQTSVLNIRYNITEAAICKVVENVYNLPRFRRLREYLNEKASCRFLTTRSFLEVPPRFELGNEGFADLSSVQISLRATRFFGNRVVFRLSIGYLTNQKLNLFPTRLFSQDSNCSRSTYTLLLILNDGKPSAASNS